MNNRQMYNNNEKELLNICIDVLTDFGCELQYSDDDLIFNSGLDVYINDECYDAEQLVIHAYKVLKLDNRDVDKINNIIRLSALCGLPSNYTE